MKKLILLGLILAVGVVRIPAAMSASYPTGQATVTLVTPFNGIPNYSGYEQVYVNEWASRAAWGYPLDNVKWTSRATVGAINATTAKTATKTATLVLQKAASASLVGVAVQAGLMVGTTYFGEWLAQEALTLVDGVVHEDDPSSPPSYELPEGGTGIGQTNFCVAGSGYYIQTQVLPMGSACPWTTGDYGSWFNWNSNSLQGDWSGTYWEMCGSRSGQGSECGSLMAHWIYAVRPKISDEQLTYVPGGTTPLSAEEMRERIEAAFDSGNSTRQQTAMEMAQGSLAAVAPYINESNKNFPTSRETSPSGSPSLTPSQVAEAQDALDDSIDPSDKADVEDQNATAPVGENDWEYTPQEMAKAQFDMDKKLDQERKAEYDSYENAVPTYDSNATIPEKDSITTKLETFMNSLSGSGGVVDTLEGMKEVQLTNASCSISADLGEWGSLEFSFCQWESVVSAFGSIMLMVCSFLWVAWFFMGRGDA